MELFDSTEATIDEELQYGLTASEVNRFIDTLDIVASDNLDFTSYTSANISIAQIYLRPYNSLPDYIREMNMLVEKAVNDKAHMICFPAFTGLLPASLFPRYHTILDSISFDTTTNLPEKEWIIRAFSELSSNCFEIYLTTMSALAKAHNIYISAGTTIYPEHSQFVHRGMLLDPSGLIVGYQDKISHSKLERTLEIEEASEVKVFETSFGMLAMAIGEDVNHFEIPKVAYAQGATILLNPTAHKAPYTGVTTSEGLNLRVQEVPMFGIAPTLIGRTPFGLSLEGNAGAFAPYSFSKKTAKNSMFVSTIKADATQLVTARLDLERLSRETQLPADEHNQEFIKQYIDYIY